MAMPGSYMQLLGICMSFFPVFPCLFIAGLLAMNTVFLLLPLSSFITGLVKMNGYPYAIVFFIAYWLSCSNQFYISEWDSKLRAVRIQASAGQVSMFALIFSRLAHVDGMSWISSLPDWIDTMVAMKVSSGVFWEMRTFTESWNECNLPAMAW